MFVYIGTEVNVARRDTIPALLRRYGRAVQPLVITVALDADAQERFDAARTRWFPPGRTEVGAHLTMFHAVPGEQEE
jgi:hypothetical protein